MQFFRKLIKGVHPDDRKKATAQKPIEIYPLPSKVILPLKQHIGSPSVALVNVGDTVQKGQVISKSEEKISSIIHASISGKVVDISNYPHPVFGSFKSLVIESDGRDEYSIAPVRNENWEKLSKGDLIHLIQDAGIVGMGGATFPTYFKLTIPESKHIDTFILNAAECEPFLTADNRMILEYMDKIISGVNICMKILEVDSCLIGIEDNKPKAISALKEAFKNTKVKVVQIPTMYPQGAEKVLIKELLNREIPPGKLPTDVGVVVQNIGTIVAIHHAVVLGEALIERVITVSGSSIKNPKNLLVRIGTPVRDIVEFCGGFVQAPVKIIVGGPMMGHAQSTLDIPVVKGMSGILFLSEADINFGHDSNCIRCGKCVGVCPMLLNPCTLALLAERGMVFEAVEEYSLLNCFECGSCSYICPAKRNLVQNIRYLKTLHTHKIQSNKGGK